MDDQPKHPFPPSSAEKIESAKNDPRLQLFVRTMQQHRADLERITDPAARAAAKQAVLKTYTSWFARKDQTVEAYSACVADARGIIERPVSGQGPDRAERRKSFFNRRNRKREQGCGRGNEWERSG